MAETTLSEYQLERIRFVIRKQLSRDLGNRKLRFGYAQASYQSGHYDAAKYHLRVLMRTVRSKAELDRLQNAYATVVKGSPWSFGLNFAFLPSTNINRTASSSTFDTPIGVFAIANGGAEESGVGLRFGGRIAYEKIMSSGISLTYGAALNRSQYPENRLNHYDGHISLTWGQRALSGFTQFTPYAARYVYDDNKKNNSDSTRYGLKLSYEHYLTHNSSMTGKISAERRNYDDLDSLDGLFLRASLSYSGKIAEDYSTRLGIKISRSTPNKEHLRYTGTILFGDLSRNYPKVGTFGIHVSMGGRQYEGLFPALGIARQDYLASIGISFSSPKIRIWKITPKLSCRVEKNQSNVALYDYQSTDCTISFQRKF